MVVAEVTAEAPSSSQGRQELVSSNSDAPVATSLDTSSLGGTDVWPDQSSLQALLLVKVLYGEAIDITFGQLADLLTLADKWQMPSTSASALSKFEQSLTHEFAKKIASVIACHQAWDREKAKELFEEAHRREIVLILELV